MYIYKGENQTNKGNIIQKQYSISEENKHSYRLKLHKASVLRKEWTGTCIKLPAHQREM